MTTPRTCAEQCWYAREEVCRCACDGANHGCLLVNGAPIPGRTKRVKDDRFRLHAVLHDVHEANDLQRYLPSSFAFQSVPKDCKWPEAKGASWGSRFVWVLATVPESEAESLVERARFENRAHDVDHHRTNPYSPCDGVFMDGNPQRPCTMPEAHQPNPEIDTFIAAMRCSGCEKSNHQWHFDIYCHCPQCSKIPALTTP